MVLEVTGKVLMLIALIPVFYVAGWSLRHWLRAQRIAQRERDHTEARVMVGLEIERAAEWYSEELPVYQTLKMLGKRLKAGESIHGPDWRGELIKLLGGNAHG